MDAAAHILWVEIVVISSSFLHQRWNGCQVFLQPFMNLGMYTVLYCNVFSILKSLRYGNSMNKHFFGQEVSFVCYILSPLVCRLWRRTKKQECTQGVWRWSWQIERLPGSRKALKIRHGLCSGLSRNGIMSTAIIMIFCRVLGCQFKPSPKSWQNSPKNIQIFP